MFPLCSISPELRRSKRAGKGDPAPRTDLRAAPVRKLPPLILATGRPASDVPGEMGVNLIVSP
jgi:hypothetical protein